MLSYCEAFDAANAINKDHQRFRVSIEPVFTHRGFDKVLTDWDQARRGDLLPARPHFDPMNYPRLMPYMGLYEPVDGGRDWRFRLHGTGLVEMFGHDDTGKAMFGDAVFTGDVRDAFTRYFELVYNWPHPVWFSGWISYWRDGSSVPYQGISLPLSQDSRTPCQNLQLFHFRKSGAIQKTSENEEPWLAEAVG